NFTARLKSETVIPAWLKERALMAYGLWLMAYGSWLMAHDRSRAMMWSATRSACATIVRPGFTAADEGKNDASTTKRFSTSWVRQNGSSTDARGSVPNTSVPHWCVVFFGPDECTNRA